MLSAVMPNASDVCGAPDRELRWVTTALRVSEHASAVAGAGAASHPTAISPLHISATFPARPGIAMAAGGNERCYPHVGSYTLLTKLQTWC